MVKNKGYILPSNVEPDDMMCLKIFIPNDARYLEAFSGQFHELATWIAWEKDGTNRASLASSVWKDAIDYTYENGWINSCCESELCNMTKDELEQLLLEVLTMNINVNCGCGCGCSNNGDLPPSDYTTPPPTTQPIPTPTTQDGLTWKCNMAHYMVYVQRLTMLKAVEWSGLYDNWNASFSLLFNLGQVNPVNFAYQPYATMLALLNGTSTANLVTSIIDPAYDELVCAIYSAGDAETAHNQFNSVLSNIFPDYVMRSLATEISSQLPMELVFQPSDLSNLPITHQNRVCTSCQSSGTTIPLPSDPRIVLVPAVNISKGTERTPSVVNVLANRVSSHGDGTGLNSDVDIDMDFVELQPVGGQLIGLGFYVVEQSSDSDPRYDHELRNVVANVNLHSFPSDYTMGVRDLAFGDQYILDYFATFDNSTFGAGIDGIFAMYTQDSLNQVNSAGFTVDVYYIYLVP